MTHLLLQQLRLFLQLHHPVGGPAPLVMSPAPSLTQPGYLVTQLLQLVLERPNLLVLNLLLSLELGDVFVSFLLGLLSVGPISPEGLLHLLVL